MNVTDQIEESIKGGIAKLGPGFVANPGLIQGLANRTKCLMCKHKKDEGHIREGERFNPSPAWLLHYEDTHGQPVDIYAAHLFFFPYSHSETGETATNKLWGNLLTETI